MSLTAIRRRLPTADPATPLAIAAATLAALIGVAIAVRPSLGFALLIGVLYAPLTFFRLDLAIVLWTPLVFLEGVPVLNLASKAAGLLLALVWLATVLTGIRDLRVLAQRPSLVWLLASLVAWLSLSVIWAESPSLVLQDIWHWWAVALLFLMVASSLASLRAIQLAVTGLVVGAATAVFLGLASGELQRSATSGDVARLKSGAGDPNVLAAGLVPAVVLAAGLMIVFTKPLHRWLLALAIALCALGLVASESRGGALAGVVTVMASMVFFPGRRGRVVGAVFLVLAVALISLALLPNAWSRITSNDNGGNGRTEIWTVAWRITQDHPLSGIGLNNFTVRAGDYVRQPGSLKRVRLLVDHPTVVHNVYLQLLAENGVVALGLFLSLVAGCLQAAWLAARTFAHDGDEAGQMLARSVLVSAIAMLTSGLFISAGVDTRMWIIFALGPALLFVARAPGGRQAAA
jgi:O-antigen ligase